MASPKDENSPKGQLKRSDEGGDKGRAQSAAGDPEWASGLKKLYDSVVEEPLPDSFKDLLSQLDENGSQ